MMHVKPRLRSTVRRAATQGAKEALIKSELPAVQGCAAIFDDDKSLKM
jgi:hypothetical protein